MSETVTGPVVGGTHPLGVSRPPLDVADLPTPEEVFGVPKVGPKEAIKYAIGPSLIALGIAIGSGEWLIGPQAVGKSATGFIGIGWIITVSALLQVVYNIEVSRYVMATGEVPVVGFGRVPPGALFWIPFSLLFFFTAFIWGGWAKGAAQGLFALITGDPPGPGDDGTVEVLSVVLLLGVLAVAVGFKKVSRGMELVNAGLITFILIFLIIVDLLIVPWDVWWEAIRGFLTPRRPPEGTTASDLGALAGFTALASGLNWFVLNHYRDKAYGMGGRVGYIAGLRGERKEVLAVGVTFPDDERNAALWRRWMRFLYLDMWGIFFVGAMVGMLLPTVLMRHLVLATGRQPGADITTFAASALESQYGRWVFYIALLAGFFVLFSTQLGIFEALVRNATDAANTNARLRTAIAGDPRRFYYPFMVVLVIVIAVVLTTFQPINLVRNSANISNGAALVYPFVLIYLNRQLPRAARPPKWTYAALMANFVFFGFLFLNWAWRGITGDQLLTF
ncbi:MAG: Nramp family divalent metal transporter [Actinomycetota bacterium]|nr:Nramp family divalent metal transporter [Actinomycetota bacterium]